MSSLRKQGSCAIMHKAYYVYILTTSKNTVLYIGVTSDLNRRIYEHKNGLVAGFTKKYNVHKLVYVESFADIEFALQREKALKKWKRDWKVELIEKTNPEWLELYSEPA